MRDLFYLLVILSVLSGRNAEPKAKANESTGKKVRQLDDEDSVTICGYEDDQSDTHTNSFLKFTTKSFIGVSEEAGGNFVYSPYSAWLSMAAIVEGSEDRKNLDDILGLPLDWCVRKRYEKTILDTERPDSDVLIFRTRALVIDENLRLKKTWQNFVPEHLRLRLITAPINSDPVTAAYAIRQIINFQFQELDLNGNSVLLDSMDYFGFWKTSFPQILNKQPFYDYRGKQTGWVDMMKTRMHARMKYLDEIKTRVLELPVGGDGRYRMLIAQYEDNVDYIEVAKSIKDDFIKNLMESLKESNTPIEIQIPRFSLYTELNLRNILEKMGVTSVWTEPSVTRHISDSPALPSAYIQRTTVSIDAAGINPTPDLFLPATAEDDTSDTGVDPVIDREFIANRPMIFGLFDAESYVCLFVGSFAVPTYSL